MAFRCGSKQRKGAKYGESFEAISNVETTKEMLDAYRTEGMKAWRKTWEILHNDTGWKHVCGADKYGGIVHYHNFPDVGRMFKLQGIIPMEPEILFREIVPKVEHNPRWTTTVLESKIIEKVDEDTDICHNITAEAAGGLVAKRDFVSLRHWRTQEGIIISATCAVEHPKCPPMKHYVRGLNKAGGWAFAANGSDTRACAFTWLVATDLKGWLPQTIIDRAIPRTLIEFFTHLKQHVKNDFMIISPSPSTSTSKN